MQPTYFASFLLGEQPSAPPPIADALETIADWIFNNHHRPLKRPQNWPRGLAEPFRFSNDTSVQVLCLNEGDIIQAAAVRYEHPDQQSRIWRTDCVLATVAETEPAVRFAVTVSAGSAIESLSPVSPPSSRPRIVRAMMDKFGAREGYPLKSTFLKIPIDDSQRFADFLLDKNRAIPIVFISRRNRDGGLMCDPTLLADKLVGIAYVCVADDAQVSWKLTEVSDNRLSAYDGAVRVYWPRMTAADPPYRHRFWTPQQLYLLENSRRNFADELLRLIATASVTRRISGLVRWEDIEREISKRTMQSLQESGALTAEASEDWLRQYEIDLRELEKVRHALADSSEQLIAKDEEVRQWKQLYLMQLRYGSASSDVSIEEDTPIEDAASAIAAATKDFSAQLEVIDGRVEKDALQFEEPELLYAAFKWLATTYWNAKSGIEGCADLDKSCTEACQFRYSAHQSDVTIGRFSSDYEVVYEGMKFKLREHIGFGSDTEPRHTIRIAFFFSEAKKKIVIGFVGQHQATRKSN